MTAPLLVLGNVNVDLVLGPVDGWPEIGTEIEVDRAEMRAGGSAGNTALALTGLGEPHLLIASTGDDPNGVWLRGEFDANNCRWIDDPGMTTTTVGIVHRGGDRAFFTTPGHLQRATPEALLARVDPAPFKGAVAILSGNLLMPKLRDATGDLLTKLRARGWQTAIDPGWPPQGWTDHFRQTMVEWLQLCDHVLLNEEETSGFGGADALLGAIPATSTLIIKRGAEGANAFRNGQNISVAAPQVEVVDTVGAGDTFNAAYLARHIAGASLENALRHGVEIASCAVSTFPRRYK
ncbi:carbohydrate kinase family protein [Aquamicrobium zhengzhouense]|uniref:Carbohydrate kinase family protein n=1 Tax=Aquamicrobium zhengzhouense TaxID=2781738 RepID=A0ABS0SED1_9HYPH|nr:carbohydrate kinase family protein [Aquamicrobium zhengzhouense]MBI1620852.1 carbohydrate kinase family protein [Aquamicrobium zhengzhouense]